MKNTDFGTFFQKATGHNPLPYQERLATADRLPLVLDVPTGLGKTSIALAWLWRRGQEEFRHGTPRRLVYCLPTRVLVNQTQAQVVVWLEALGLRDQISVHVLMGGAVDGSWDIHPDQDAILIGTLDQLLSRALNRGYALNRARWPIHFGLLHSDAHWVFDEVQLMGPGLPTSVQLEGLRQRMGVFGQACSTWMSATMPEGWLDTPDHRDPGPGASLGLSEADREHPVACQRLGAAKAITQATIEVPWKAKGPKDFKSLAEWVLAQHQPEGFTMVVLNRVPRAQQLFQALQALIATSEASPQLALLHSRFRAADRLRQEGVALGEKEPSNLILVTTQAVEAGVDISAQTLITELAPWSSLVQRLGRCNRYGHRPDARVFWLNLPTEGDGKEAREAALPYEPIQLNEARKALMRLGPEANPVALKAAGLEVSEGLKLHATLRHTDLMGLFDTTSDLLGLDLDVTEFIRPREEAELQVAFWFEEGPPPKDHQPTPEACVAVKVAALQDFIKGPKGAKAFSQGPVEGIWTEVRDQRNLKPGMQVWLRAEAGGYRSDLGWTGNAAHLPEPLPGTTQAGEGLEGDGESRTGTWLSLAEHTEDVVQAMERLLKSLGDQPAGLPHAILRQAAREHDWGKSHPAFQQRIGRPPDGFKGAGANTHWAKSGEGTQAPEGAEVLRKPFRHELASALAILAGEDPQHPDDERNLLAYLVASHHGKVRTRWRAAPNESGPQDAPEIAFAMGVWQGDELPTTDLGDGPRPSVTLNVELMSLGDGPDGRISWGQRVAQLLAKPDLGPFRLAYLEALLRAADARGSQAGAQRPLEAAR